MSREIRSILVVTLSNLGDVVLTLPVFQSLKTRFPVADIDVIVGPGAVDVFFGDKRIRKTMIYNKRIPFSEKLKFLSEVRKNRYDLIIDLRYSLIGLLGGSRIRNPYFSLKKKFKHRTLRHLSAITSITGDVSPRDGFLRSVVSEEAEALGIGQIIVAAPGSKSSTKKWPAEHFAKLLDRLAEQHKARIVLVGDVNDAEDAKRVTSLMKAPVIDKSGKTDFKTLVSIMARASLVVTNDSAPLHIADALGVPTLVFFGPTDPKKYGPRHTSSRALSRTLFCIPCEAAQCRYKHECLKELTVDEAYVAATKILEHHSHADGQKILVIRLDRIGDAVLSLPAIEAIRERFPNAHLTVMTRPYTMEVFQGHPAIDEVISYDHKKGGRHRVPFGYFRLIRGLVKRHFDAAFVLRPSVRAHLIPFLAGIPFRVGMDRSWPFLLTHRAEDKRNLGLRHESEYALDVVRAFGIEVTSVKPPRIESFEVGERIPSKRWIAFHAGASCPSKRWPLDRFIELAKKVLALPGDYSVALVGGSEEKASGEQFTKILGPRAFSFAGEFGIKESAAFFKKCEALVTNDSGPAHIAAAAGTRVVAVFGRNDPGLGVARWKPMGEGHATIHKDVGCAVCLAHACTIDFECLKAISVDEVFQALCLDR